MGAKSTAAGNTGSRHQDRAADGICASPRRPTSRAASFDQVGLISLIGADEYVDVVCHAMMGGAEHALSKLQASLTFVRVSAPEDWSKVERLTRAGGMDGWLLYGAVDDATVSRLQAGKLPYVVLGDHRCTRPVAS